MDTDITTKLSSRQPLHVRYLPAAAALPETLLVKLQPFQFLLQPLQLSSGILEQVWVCLHSNMHCEHQGQHETGQQARAIFMTPARRPSKGSSY